MTDIDPQAAMSLLQSMLQPWHESLANPEQAQNEVLNRLLIDYAKTVYGRRYSASLVDTIDDFRNAFPIVNYDQDIKPLIDRVMAGEIELLLWEEPVGWAITRGTTRGESKFIPMTPTDLQMRVSAGRAVMNYCADNNRLEIFQGVNLNLNFPSIVGTIRAGDREIEYGYSSGIYARHVSKMTPVRSVPSQDEIDALGGGKSIKAWEKRFDLAFEKCMDENVSLVGGVCPTAIRFGKYMNKAYKKYPKDIWDTQLMTLGSVPGINTRYRPALRAMYGRTAIREIYGATEGMFGQQRDEKRAWVPNYDLFFFEVATRNGLKMLYEMSPGEMGSLIVSTPVLPRYRIGDLIRAYEPPYFRCIGRDRWYTPLKYLWDELTSGGLDQL